MEEENIISAIIMAQIGTKKQHDIIQAHMEEYFKRWPSYKDRLNNLEWYHLFLDFYEKIESDCQKAFTDGQNSIIPKY